MQAPNDPGVWSDATYIFSPTQAYLVLWVCVDRLMLLRPSRGKNSTIYLSWIIRGLIDHLTTVVQLVLSLDMNRLGYIAIQPFGKRKCRYLDLTSRFYQANLAKENIMTG